MDDEFGGRGTGKSVLRFDWLPSITTWKGSWILRKYKVSF